MSEQTVMGVRDRLRARAAASRGNPAPLVLVSAESSPNPKPVRTFGAVVRVVGGCARCGCEIKAGRRTCDSCQHVARRENDIRHNAKKVETRRLARESVMLTCVECNAGFTGRPHTACCSEACRHTRKIRLARERRHGVRHE